MSPFPLLSLRPGPRGPAAVHRAWRRLLALLGALVVETAVVVTPGPWWLRLLACLAAAVTVWAIPDHVLVLRAFRDSGWRDVPR